MKKGYFNQSSYEYQWLTKNDKQDEELLFTISYNFIFGCKKDKVIYDYYDKKFFNNIFITYKTDKNKIGIEINKKYF